MPWFLSETEKYRDYSPPFMTDVQIQALESRIAASNDAGVFAKKAIIWALRRTMNLRSPVALSVFDKDFGPFKTRSVQDGAHDMVSSNGTTHLDNFLAGMGTEMRLMHHCGCFVEREGDPFDSEAKGRTIWFAYVYYTRDVVILPSPSLETIEAIELSSM